MSTFLVCASAEHPTMVAGSIFVKCSQCEIALMMAPSGQRLIAHDPAIQPVCERCSKAGIKAARAAGEPVRMGLAAPLPDILAELRNPRPNLRRYRN